MQVRTHSQSATLEVPQVSYCRDMLKFMITFQKISTTLTHATRLLRILVTALTTDRRQDIAIVI
jgi:ribosomal protein L17